MTPTRRVVLGGALAAAVWRLRGQAQADGAPAQAAKGFLGFEAAPAKLQLAPPPAEPAAACAYAGAIPGPLIRLRRGEELRLKFANKLPDPTTLSFPGLRAANAAAGIGGLTQERLQPGASADIRFVAPDSGFNLYLPHAGLTDASQQGRGLFGPIIVDETTIRTSIWTQRSSSPTGTSTQTGKSRTILPIPPPVEEAGARAASCSPMAPPRH